MQARFSFSLFSISLNSHIFGVFHSLTQTVYHIGGSGKQKIERWTKSKPDELKFTIEESKIVLDEYTDWPEVFPVHKKFCNHTVTH